MENLPSHLDIKNLVKELEQGKEVAKQLQINFNVQSSSHETRQFLLHKILNSYDQALSILGHANTVVGGGGGDAPPPVAVDSPHSLAGSLHSDDSDQDLKDHAARKRKAMPRWTHKVQVWPGTEIEKQLDDGHGWRKYGQKDILGAKYPRGYYRCTYRHGQGCLATKQVQRSDDDPTTFEITYRGKHTCNPGGNSNNNDNNNNNNNNNNQLIAIPDPHNEDSNLPENPYKSLLRPEQNEPTVFTSTQTSTKVITQDLDTSQYSFEQINIQDNQFFFENYPPNLTPHWTPDSNYFTSLPNFTNSMELTNDLRTTSELDRIVTGTTSVSNAPTIGPDFPFSSTEFGSNFFFEGYFP